MLDAYVPLPGIRQIAGRIESTQGRGCRLAEVRRRERRAFNSAGHVAGIQSKWGVSCRRVGRCAVALKELPDAGAKRCVAVTEDVPRDTQPRCEQVIVLVAE